MGNEQRNHKHTDDQAGNKDQNVFCGCTHMDLSAIQIPYAFFTWCLIASNPYNQRGCSLQIAERFGQSHWPEAIQEVDIRNHGSAFSFLLISISLVWSLLVYLKDPNNVLSNDIFILLSIVTLFSFRLENHFICPFWNSFCLSEEPVNAEIKNWFVFYASS